MNAVELIDVTVIKGKTTILKHVSFSLKRGEGAVIIGPSGAGKSTLLRVIAGLESLFSGKVLLRGRLATDGPKILIPPEQRKVGFVFQDLALWPHMTVFSNVEFALKARGMPKRERIEKVLEILDTLELTPHRDKYPSQLSGGQRQRVALARVLVVDPDILLLDEPLSSLDQGLKTKILQLLKSLHNTRRFAFLYVSHDTLESSQLNTRKLFLNKGELTPGP